MNMESSRMAQNSETVRTASSAGPLVSVRNLTTAFRVGGQWKSIVRDMSFDIAEGETLAIVGESGSGKSVTSLSMMRLLNPATSRIGGEVLLGGRNLVTLPEREMQRVRGNDMTMIFQEPMTSLNPILPIGAQIAEALRIHRDISASEARHQVINILEKVRIPNAASRFDEYPHQFSGGMRQRVMIAMALATRPKLLIADEPTTALDVTIQGQILNLIKILQEEEGMSVLFITHDMGVVAEVSDRCLVMYRGEMVEIGTTREVFRNGQHPYTRSLIMAVPPLGSMAGTVLPARFPIADPETGAVTPGATVADTVAGGLTPVLDVRNLTTRFDIFGGALGRKLCLCLLFGSNLFLRQLLGGELFSSEFIGNGLFSFKPFSNEPFRGLPFSFELFGRKLLGKSLGFSFLRGFFRYSAGGSGFFCKQAFFCCAGLVSLLLRNAVFFSFLTGCQFICCPLFSGLFGRVFHSRAGTPVHLGRRLGIKTAGYKRVAQRH